MVCCETKTAIDYKVDVVARFSLSKHDLSPSISLGFEKV
jgi:hypothetical protein